MSEDVSEIIVEFRVCAGLVQLCEYLGKEGKRREIEIRTGDNVKTAAMGNRPPGKEGDKFSTMLRKLNDM